MIDRKYLNSLASATEDTGAPNLISLKKNVLFYMYNLVMDIHTLSLKPHLKPNPYPQIYF